MKRWVKAGVPRRWYRNDVPLCLCYQGQTIPAAAVNELMGRVRQRNRGESVSSPVSQLRKRMASPFLPAVPWLT